MYEVMKKEPIVRKRSSKNATGIPDKTKHQFEIYSGMSFDNVRVHYNSDKPRQMQALAYTQADQVYIAPGQERHLEHELGHIVQQRRGQVHATGSLNGQAINDSPALEHEADMMAEQINYTQDNLGEESGKAVHMQAYPVTQLKRTAIANNIIQMLTKDQAGKVNDIVFTDSFADKHIGGRVGSKTEGKRKGKDKGIERGVPNSSLILLDKDNLRDKVFAKKEISNDAHAQISERYKSQIYFKMKGLPCSNYSQEDEKSRLDQNECVLVGQWDEGKVAINHYEGNVTNFPANNDTVRPVNEIALFFDHMQAAKNTYIAKKKRPYTHFNELYMYYLKDLAHRSDWM